MNYQRIYDAIIERAKSRGLNKKFLDGYFERHHIVPKCMNGSNDKSNLVLLTAREHYLCHWLLWKANKDSTSLTMAYHKMMHRSNKFQSRKFNITSKQYESLKFAHSLQVSKRMKGRVKSEEEIEKLKLSRKGYKHSNETLSKLKSSMTNSNVRQKISLAAKERPKLFGKDARCKRKCFIDDVEFFTLKDGAKYAKEKYNISHCTMIRRFKSENFPNFKC